MLVKQAREKLENLLDLAKQKALEQFDKMTGNLGGLIGSSSADHCDKCIAEQATEIRILAEQTYLKAVCHECCCWHDH